MRQASLALTVILLLIAVITWLQPERSHEPKPWDIQLMTDGNSQVFNLHLGTSPLSEAQALFNDHGKVAIFSQVDKRPAVEVYFDSINLAGLSAKVILILDVSAAEVDAMLARSVKVTQQKSGSKKHQLAPSDSQLIVTKPIRSLSYIPSVTIDKTMAKSRFGRPQSIENLNGMGNETWHYPAINLKIFFNPDNKTILYFHHQQSD